MGLRALLLATAVGGALFLASVSAAAAQQNIVDGYNAYNAAVSAGDQATADAVLAQLTSDCGALGYGDVNACVNAALNPPQAEMQEPETPSGPTPEELEARFQQEIAPAIADFNNAYDLANGGGDYDQAQAVANDAINRMGQICANYGRGDVASCVGQLPDLPRPQPQGPTQEELDNQFAQESAIPLADYQSALDSAAAGGDYNDAVLRANDAAARLAQICANFGRATDPVNCVGFELPAIPQPPAGPSPEELAQQQFFADVKQAYDDYNGAIAQVQAGADYDAWKAGADAAAARLLQICNANGYGTVVDCIQQELPQFPERPQTAQSGTDAGTPASPQEPDTAAVTAAIQAAYNEYMSIHQKATDGGDLATLQPLADEAQGRILTNCQLLGVQTIVDCIQFELPPLPAPSSGAVATTPATPEGGTTVAPGVDIAAIEQRLSDAAGVYQANLSTAQAGDATAIQLVNDARTAMIQACAELGRSLLDCVGAESIPEVTAPAAVAVTPTTPGTDAGTPAVDLAAIEGRLAEAAVTYQAYLSKAQAGDAIAIRLANDARATMIQACAELGRSLLDCVGAESIPEVTAPAAVAGGGSGTPATPDAAPGGGATQDELIRRGGILAQTYADAVVRALRTGDLETERPTADKALADLKQVCSALGVPELVSCVGDLPEFPQTSPGPGVQVDPGFAAVGVDTQTATQLDALISNFNANMESPAPGFNSVAELARIQAVCDSAGLGDAEACAQAAGLFITTVGTGTLSPELKDRLSNALEAYKAAVAQAEAGGDYAAAKAVADKAGPEVIETCRIMGRPFLGYCIGQSKLPPFPAPSVPRTTTIVAGTIDDSGNLVQQIRSCDATGACTETLEVPAKAAELGRIATLVDEHNAAINDPNFDRDLAVLTLSELCNQTGVGDLLACVAQTGRTLWPKATSTASTAPTVSLAEAIQPAVNIYDGLIDAFIAQGEASGARAQLPAARQQVAEICASYGLGDVDGCLESLGWAKLRQLPPIMDASLSDVARRVATLIDEYNTRLDDPNFDPEQAKLNLVASCEDIGQPDLFSCAEYVGRTLKQPNRSETTQADAGGGTLTADELAQQLVVITSLVDNYNASLNEPGFDPLPAKAILSDLCERSGLGGLETCVARTGRSLAMPGAPIAIPDAIVPGGTDSYRTTIQNAVATYNANVPPIVGANFDRRGTEMRIGFLCRFSGLGDTSACLSSLGISLDAPSLEQLILEAAREYEKAVDTLNEGYTIGGFVMDRELAIISTHCQALGHTDLGSCLEAVGATLPPERPPAFVERQAGRYLPEATSNEATSNKGGAATAVVVTLTDEERARLVRVTQTAPQGYLDAINGLSIGGDYADARDIAMTHLAELQEACTRLGTPSLTECVPGVVLPPFPEPDLQAGGGAKGGSGTLTSEQSAEALRRVAVLVDDYNARVNDPSFDPLSAKARLNDLCEASGLGDLATCISGLGLSLNDASREQKLLEAVNAYTIATDNFNAGDVSAGPRMDAELAIIRTECQALGHADLAPCLAAFGATLPPTPRNKAGSATAVAVALTDEERARLVRVIQTAPQGYLDAINGLSIGGDYADARDIAMTHLAELQDACTRLGTPSLTDCVPGIVLPPFPEPGAQVAAGNLTAEERLAQQVAASNAYADYIEAMDGAVSGKIRKRVGLGDYDTIDYETARLRGEQAQQKLQAACFALGVTVNECIGRDLPKFPANPGTLDADERLDKSSPDSLRRELRSMVAYRQPFIDDFNQYGDANSDARMKLEYHDQQIADLCTQLAYSDIASCLSAEGISPLVQLPPLQTAKPQPTKELPALTQAERDAQVAKAQTATADYFAAIDAAKVDYDAAFNRAAGARQALSEACAALGDPDVDHCIGMTLPAFPPRETAAAATGTGTGTGATIDPGAAAREELARARNGYEAGNAAMLALAKSGGAVGDSSKGQVMIATAINQITTTCNAIAGSEVINLASPMSALDDCLVANGLPPLSTPWHMVGSTLSPEVLANLKMMVGDYNALAQSTAPFDKDGLQKAIGDYCAANGLGDLKSCLGTAGLLLADQSVTTATMEKLPDGTTPTNAAPLLDSAKGGTTVQTTLPTRGATTVPATATTLTTLTTVSVPKTDAEAQVNLPKVALPASLESGTPVDASTVRFTPPKSLPGGAGQAAAGKGLETSINLSATITPDGGFVFNLGGQVVISNPEQERKRVFDPKKDRIGYEKLTDDRVRETVLRPDGKKLITIRSNTGEVAQREVVLPSGKSFTLAAGTGPRLPNNKGDGRWRDPGDDLPPLRLTIPAEDYVLDADEVEADDLQFFLVQPPVERVARVYAIEEVKQSARVRDSVRRLEVGDLTFDSGKSTLPSRQIGSLEDIADAMLELLERNPAETFLIEGHTDAVGDETSNLALSDDRALEVARVLSEEYDVPPENLATQGYGETFLKVKTESAEAANRRVTIRRITPLITVASAR